MGAMGHTKTIEMKIPQENKKECLKFAKTFELKLPIAGIVMLIKSRCALKNMILIYDNQINKKVGSYNAVTGLDLN